MSPSEEREGRPFDARDPKSQSRSLPEIRAAGADWISESEIARICDAINAAEMATSSAHDALYADPLDRQAVSDAIWKIHDILRELRDGVAEKPLPGRWPGRGYGGW